MKNRNICFAAIAIVGSIAIVFSACRKINESTELGGGLIPPVDNIITFDTLIDVQAFNDTFGLANDSQYLSRRDLFFLGRINNDPLFGATDAKIFFELKPFAFPFYFRETRDKVTIDSVVLIMHYVSTYGDTNVAQIINVYEIDGSNDFRSDSFYLVRKSNFTYSNLLGVKAILPRTLNDSIKAFGDTTSHQLRIRLNAAFASRLLNYDTSATGAYRSDSLFRTNFKGFAVESLGPGNAVMGFDLNGRNTALAIYYKYQDAGGPGSNDTTVTYFVFKGNSGKQNSAYANYVKRDYSGTPLLASLNNGPVPDPILYIQNSPGTFASLKIPDLPAISNRVVHRAELIVEQLYHPTDTMFPPPDYLYLDAFDPSITGSNKFRTIPYDLTFTSAGGLNLGALGVKPIVTEDAARNKIRTWKFNISRYVQHILTRTQTSYDLRLWAPFTFTNQFGVPPGPDVLVRDVQLNPTIVRGRVRLVGSDPTRTDPRRIRLRIVYSKL